MSEIVSKNDSQLFKLLSKNCSVPVLLPDVVSPGLEGRAASHLG